MGVYLAISIHISTENCEYHFDQISVWAHRMSEEKQHHHLFHHQKEDGESADVRDEGNVKSEEKAKKEEKRHKHLEETGGLGAVATGGFALHEKHEEKKDP